MDRANLRECDKRHIQDLLDDPSILGILSKGNQLPKKIVIHNNGDITAYYNNSGGKWWGNLLGDYKDFAFSDFAFKAARVLSGVGKDKNKIVFNGLANTIIEKAIEEDDYITVVDALFDNARFGGGSNVVGSKFVNINNKSCRTVEGICKLNSGENYGPVIRLKIIPE